jgi:hypothetical protein
VLSPSPLVVLHAQVPKHSMVQAYRSRPNRLILLYIEVVVFAGHECMYIYTYIYTHTHTLMYMHIYERNSRICWT